MGRRISESPVAPLVAFSAATDLGIAGRAFRCTVVPEATRALLIGFGAREDPRADLGLVAEGAPSSAVARLDHAPRRLPTSVAAAAPLTETDDEVAAELIARGVAVHDSAAATPAEEHAHALALLDHRPQLLVDDGAHGIRLAHTERPDVVAGLLGATEETMSGVMPLRDSPSSSPSLDAMADVAVLARIAPRQGCRRAGLHERLLSAGTFGGVVRSGSLEEVA
jgi:adenosylhomocysteinase